MIRIISDYSELDRELDRLEDQPNGKAKAILGGTLTIAKAEVVAAVHVDTGSLKGSVKTTSKSNSATDVWEGEIEVGGASTGVNTPVDYAIYEKARGEDHDFMQSLETTGRETFANAVLIALKGG